MQVSAVPQNRWSRHWVFILAVAGSTAGLGNVWKFPYLVSENGGFAFLGVYLLCLLMLGGPMMMAELALGRSGQGSPLRSIAHAVSSNKTSNHWIVIAFLCLLTGFLVFAFYSVVSGWVLGYFFSAAAGDFSEIGSNQLEQNFLSLLSDPIALTIWHSLFMVLVCSVLLKGVRGLDHAIRVLMPGLFLLLFVLLLAVLLFGDMSAAWDVLFASSPIGISYDIWVAALSHAFFTLSLGMGVLLAYGRHLPDNVDIGRSVMLIILVDTLIGLLFGLVIYGFSAGGDLNVERGPGLLFVSLPFVFDSIGVGNWLSACFFLAVVIIVWTSTVALLEPLVQTVHERYKLSRHRTVAAVGGSVWLLGLLALLSFNELAGVQLNEMTLFDLLDFVSAKILLPVTGLLMVLFVGWQLKPEFMQQALGTKTWMFNGWLVLIRFGVPILLVLVISSSLQSRF